MRELKKNEVQISIDDWSKTYINNLLKMGGYMSVSEIFREALRMHQDNFKRAKVMPFDTENTT